MFTRIRKNLKSRKEAEAILEVCLWSLLWAQTFQERWNIWGFYCKKYIEKEAYVEMISSWPKDYESHDIQVNRIRKAASVASKRCENRMIRKGLRNNPPSLYNIGEKVLIRYPPAKKLCSRKSFLTARILNRNLKTCKYKVQFTYPAGSLKTLTKWISVNDITSTTIDREKRKRKLACQSNKKRHKKKYLILFSNNREKFTDIQSKINFFN